MSKVTRYSNMIPGGYCAVMINGVIKNQEVHADKKGELYITYKGKRYHESEMPMGEEVEV